MGWVRYIFAFLFIMGIASAQPFIMTNKERRWYLCQVITSLR